MSGAWLAQLRWRRRGAWLWPAFVVVTVFDAVIANSLPLTGESQSLGGALVLACFVNLIAVLLLSRPLGAVIRRYRKDLPSVVARDYGGRVALGAVAAVTLAAGLAHHPVIVSHRKAMEDAITRAQAWIGDTGAGRVPAQRTVRQHVHDRTGPHLPYVRTERPPGSHVLRDREYQTAVCRERAVRRL